MFAKEGMADKASETISHCIKQVRLAIMLKAKIGVTVAFCDFFF